MRKHYRAAKTALQLLITLILVLLLFNTRLPAASAQGDSRYVVQPGDTLTTIALRFQTTVAELASVNSIYNPNLIYVGQVLHLPSADVRSGQSPGDASLPAAAGFTYQVQPRDTLNAISFRFGVPMAEIIAANRIANPNLLYVGQTLSLPLPPLYQAPLPHPFRSVELSETPIAQGRTLLISVSLAEPALLRGNFQGQPVPFASSAASYDYWAIVGMHAMLEPGSYPLALTAYLEDGSQVTAALNVPVVAGPYGTENIILLPGRETLLDPKVLEQENAKVRSIWSVVTAQQLWEGSFSQPLEQSQVTSPFGTRRSYNYGPAVSFHEGTDFRGATGTPLYAPARGEVALAEQLVVRGGAILLDHGLGVYSGYWHLSDILVQVGQTVQRGELIGYVGDTGLVTGAHLHWEMRVRGVAVDPMQWLAMTFP